MSPAAAEMQRLAEEAGRRRNWKRWGPYLPDRQWGTVREDYSADGNAWDSFSHDQARSRAYRWGEDGLLGWTDRQCRLCFAPALWNGKDPILKERLFGLTGPQGNHGEDVKERYYHLDATPTHSYNRALYRYPHEAYPYQHLIDANRARGRLDPEFEIHETGVFKENRFCDLTVEYAKAGPDDTLIRLTVVNRGPERTVLTVLPTVWFRNTWVWGCRHEGCTPKPSIRRDGHHRLNLDHPSLGAFVFEVDPVPALSDPGFLFTDNETNTRRLHGSAQGPAYAKDAFHRFLVDRDPAAINPAEKGTKAAALCRIELDPGGTRVLRCRLHARSETPDDPFGTGFDGIFNDRIKEADAFYRELIPQEPGSAEAGVQRSAYAGLLWTKKFYHYSVADWLRGDAEIAPVPAGRETGRNAEWKHLFNRDILSMPDGWEYPWYAAWDTAFHMIPFAHLDPEFAKDQLILLLREWYLHPNGQIPAYEWAFSDVNPPVHAWACWRVYKMTGKTGNRDIGFLKRVFHKLLLNFTWWVNRKDPDGRNLFTGGFLGLDNIGVFDRSKPAPTGGHLEQADGTAWMAFFCTTMLAIALELADEDESYQDIASKFFEHFVAIADAINHIGGDGLWDEEDGFYHDQIQIEGRVRPLLVRSMVGLIPLLAVEILDDKRLARVPLFTRRMQWFCSHREDVLQLATFNQEPGRPGSHLLAIPSRPQLQRVLTRLFDEEEFLSPYGIRSLSRHHRDHPYQFHWDGQTHTVGYEPGESETPLFGGNSNWRGPVWFPVNFLLIEALERYHHFFGDSFRIELPTGSGHFVSLGAAADEIARRLSRLFLEGADGRRPADGGSAQNGDPILFHEYFHAETGAGLGASHQTGWTALVAKLLEDAGSSPASSGDAPASPLPPR